MRSPRDLTTQTARYARDLSVRGVSAVHNARYHNSGARGRARRHRAGRRQRAVRVMPLVALERRAEHTHVMLGADDVELMPVVRANHVEDAGTQRPYPAAREVGQLAL